MRGRSMPNAASTHRWHSRFRRPVDIVYPPRRRYSYRTFRARKGWSQIAKGPGCRRTFPRNKPVAPMLDCSVLACPDGRWPRHHPDRSKLDLAFFGTFPVGCALGRNLDQDQSWRIGALLKPFIEIAGPMLLESRFIADKFGLSFDGDINAAREKTAFRGKAKGYLWIFLNVGDSSGLVRGEVVRRAIICGIAVIAHGTV